MNEKITILGLVGPSAVGKGYCKEAIKVTFEGRFEEPVVLTTRPKRVTDGKDRLAGIPLKEFLSMRDSGTILFAHQPFGSEADWYGFSRESFEAEGKLLLTEVHVDNIEPFKKGYGDQVCLIALIADKSYLERNLRERNTEEEGTIRKRLDAAWHEVEKIKTLKAHGLIDRVIEVSDKNREKLSSIVTNLVKEIFD